MVTAEGSLSCEGNASMLLACLRAGNDENGRVRGRTRTRRALENSARDMLRTIAKATPVGVIDTLDKAVGAREARLEAQEGGNGQLRDEELLAIAESQKRRRRKSS